MQLNDVSFVCKIKEKSLCWFGAPARVSLKIKAKLSQYTAAVRAL